MMITPRKYYSALPPEVAAMFVDMAEFMYAHIDFNMPDSPLHAKEHCERVLLHALSMGVAEMGADDTEALEILAHAAVFHDTRRQDEYLDTGHGARAAVNYERFCRESGCRITYHPEAAYLMRYHDLDDSEGIKTINRDFPEKAERVRKLYAIFKDADALDRWRLGKWGLDVSYLRTPSARRLVDTARELVADTMDPAILAHFDRLMDDIYNKKQ